MSKVREGQERGMESCRGRDRERQDNREQEARGKEKQGNQEREARHKGG